jgi:hypothetical protein
MRRLFPLRRQPTTPPSKATTKMPLKSRDFYPGRNVLWVPKHAKGDTTHPDVEKGVVTTTNPLVVFVRFKPDATPQACYPEDLVYDFSASSGVEQSVGGTPETSP